MSNDKLAEWIRDNPDDVILILDGFAVEIGNWLDTMQLDRPKVQTLVDKVRELRSREVAENETATREPPAPKLDKRGKKPPALIPETPPYPQ